MLYNYTHPVKSVHFERPWFALIGAGVQPVTDAGSVPPCSSSCQLPGSSLGWSPGIHVGDLD